MRIKKTVSFALVVVMLFALAISTFAEARTTSSGTYSAGKVKHKFTTTKSVTKSASETWVKIEDVVSYSKFCTEGSDVEDLASHHVTYLADSNGNKLSSFSQDIWLADTGTFPTSVVEDLSDYSTIKLQIYNPKYGTEWYLKTAGTIKGTAA